MSLYIILCNDKYDALCVEQRLSYYKDGNTKEICNYECLVDDSALDRTGHYLVRLYAHLNTNFQPIFLRNEKKLLSVRLTCYNKEDVRNFFKKILKHSKECLNENGSHATVKEILKIFISLCLYMLNRKYLDHIFKDIHIGPECEEFTIKIPFYICPSLVSCRKVNLNKGYAEVHCSNWKDLLLSIYETYLTTAVNEMKYSRNAWLTANDTRIKNTFQLIQNQCFENERGIDNTLKSKFDISKINLESKLFPLCMLNLFKVLQVTHRLPHNERFDFSLYMKGIGITLSDSIKFWKNAYSQQSSCSRCSHNWKNNEKRYIYSIRHLYGLEGSRRNYDVSPCNYFQEKILSATEDGGCPFKHFDDNNLRQVLKKLLPNKEGDVEVMIYERKQNPTKSCKIFYENIFTTINNKSTIDNINFTNPVEYYLSLKEKACN